MSTSCPEEYAPSGQDKRLLDLLSQDPKEVDEQVLVGKVKRLLDEGASPDARQYGDGLASVGLGSADPQDGFNYYQGNCECALGLAARNLWPEVVSLLLARGASVYWPENDPVISRVLRDDATIYDEAMGDPLALVVDCFVWELQEIDNKSEEELVVRMGLYQQVFDHLLDAGADPFRGDSLKIRSPSENFFLVIAENAIDASDSPSALGLEMHLLDRFVDAFRKEYGFPGDDAGLPPLAHLGDYVDAKPQMRSRIQARLMGNQVPAAKATSHRGVRL